MNRYKYTGATELCPSASHTDGIRKPTSVATLNPLALRRTREYANPISSSVGNCRSGCSAAIWVNIDVIGAG